MFTTNILDNRDYQPIKEMYEQWHQYMEKNVEFWLPDSEWHTKSHCSRVLLLALLIGHQKGLSAEEMDALGMAAIFHDSRRLDDGIDKGHGGRAAEYYKEYCREHGLPYDEQTYYMTYYHDQDDSLGLSEIAKSSSLSERAVLLYQIFKDADALDRFRLGPDGLDVKFLRTKEAHGLVDFAKDLLRKSNETNS
ncbi:HD domain-containing protein [Sporosarcina cascadiensis]|uniref:HD domain-containing protein n=1 Tax=Sporosarcina cascadiensis TaxID=2660747 RepID=UPI001E3DAA3D|nr:HD domain-containing protein [Sporosarcina cascadiensis]